MTTRDEREVLKRIIEDMVTRKTEQQKFEYLALRVGIQEASRILNGGE